VEVWLGVMVPNTDSLGAWYGLWISNVPSMLILCVVFHFIASCFMYMYYM
jgi:hypothetical protein